MRMKYDGDCAEYEAAIVKILKAGMAVTKDDGKRKRYASAIEAIADNRLEKAEEKIVKVFDVNVVRKETVTVTASDESDAERKAVESIGVRDNESVTADAE